MNLKIKVNLVQLLAVIALCLMLIFVVLQTMGNLGSSDVDSRLEEQLIDGILYAFQEQTQEASACLFNVHLECLSLFYIKKNLRKVPFGKSNDIHHSSFWEVYQIINVSSNNLQQLLFILHLLLYKSVY